VYVGYQVRQSNRIATAECMRSVQTTDFLDQYDMANVGRGFNDFESLDFKAKWDFHAYMMRFLNHYQMALDSVAIGLIPDTNVDAFTKVVAEVLVTPGVQQYLQDGGRGYYVPSMMKIAEDYIEINSENLIPYNAQSKWMAASA
jgi:hypothetical protein